MNGQHAPCVTVEPGYPGRIYFHFVGYSTAYRWNYAQQDNMIMNLQAFAPEI